MRAATVMAILVLAWTSSARTSDGTAPIDPGPKSILGTARCRLPLWFDNARIGLKVIVDPHAQWSRYGTAKVDFIAEALIPASLAQQIIDVPGRMEELSIAELQTELRVRGGTPSSIRIIERGQTYELDRDGDGIAEDVIIRMRAATRNVTNDGADWVQIDIRHFVTWVEHLPLVKSLVMSDTRPPSSMRRPCKLGSEPVRFRVAR